MREVAEGNQEQKMVIEGKRKRQQTLKEDAASLGQPICNVGGNPTCEFEERGRWVRDPRPRISKVRPRRGGDSSS